MQKSQAEIPNCSTGSYLQLSNKEILRMGVVFKFQFLSRAQLPLTVMQEGSSPLLRSTVWNPCLYSPFQRIKEGSLFLNLVKGGVCSPPLWKQLPGQRIFMWSRTPRFSFILCLKGDSHTRIYLPNEYPSPQLVVGRSFQSPSLICAKKKKSRFIWPKRTKAKCDFQAQVTCLRG